MVTLEIYGEEARSLNRFNKLWLIIRGTYKKRKMEIFIPLASTKEGIILYIPPREMDGKRKTMT